MSTFHPGTIWTGVLSDGEWYRPHEEPVTIPDFIKGRAEGLYILHNGKVHRRQRNDP